MSVLNWLKCVSCKKWKEDDFFYMNKKRCKKCHIDSVIKSRKKNKNKYNSYMREYNKKYITEEKRKILNHKARIKYHSNKNE